MRHCLTPEQLFSFLELIDVTTTKVENVIFVHATDSIVAWVFNGATYCATSGIGV